MRFLIWFRMRCANILAYLLSYQGEDELADAAEERERFWAAELAKYDMNQRLGGLRGDASWE